MSLLYIVLVLIAVGVLLYLVNLPNAPIQGQIKQIINWVVIGAVVIWLLLIALHAAGVAVPNPRVG